MSSKGTSLPTCVHINNNLDNCIDASISNLYPMIVVMRIVVLNPLVTMFSSTLLACPNTPDHHILRDQPNEITSNVGVSCILDVKESATKTLKFAVKTGTSVHQ